MRRVLALAVLSLSLSVTPARADLIISGTRMRTGRPDDMAVTKPVVDATTDPVLKLSMSESERI